MRRFIHRENIRHFRALLDAETDETKRAIIQKLLIDEEAKEAGAEGLSASVSTTHVSQSSLGRWRGRFG